MDFVTIEEISKNLIECIQSGMIETGHDTTVIFYDFDYLSNKVITLSSAFPEKTLHTAAIKANPLVKILEKVNNLNIGVEAASEGELYLAEKSGFHPAQIVFDSPAKTITELLYALSKNMHINADSFMELERIRELKSKINASGNIGLRINPQVGYGTIAATSVAGDYSKFGVPVKEFRKEIINTFEKYEWLSGLHIHIGSQGCSMQMLLKGFEEILILITEIEKKIGRQLLFFDIGGGLPVSYSHKENAPDIIEYGLKIQELLKKYKLEHLRLITEFGRYLHANSGYTISKIEYVKHYWFNPLLIGLFYR